MGHISRYHRGTTRGSGGKGETENQELEERLAAILDLGKGLRWQSPQIKRQVFEAFDLRITVDRAEGRVQMSATVSEEIAKALTKGPLARGGVWRRPLTDKAGARFVSQGVARMLERSDYQVLLLDGVRAGRDNLASC